jgi:glycosyltransferase involved in cell wall biosynthesis
MLSVIMSVYNAENYLDRSVTSILNQSYKNFDFLIIDDCSTDSSKNILSDYAKRDSRIKLYQAKKNRGITDSLNFLIEKSSRRFIARMDADDISAPTRFEKQICFLLKNKNYSVVGSFVNLIDNNEKIIKRIMYPTSSLEIKKKLNKRSCMPHPATMFNSYFLNKIGCYRPCLEPAEDYDLWTRLSTFSDLANIPEYLFFYRKNQNGISNTRAFEQYYKTEFVKKNYSYIKNNKDLIKMHNIKKIDKKVLLTLFKEKNFFLLDLSFMEMFINFKKNYKLKRLFQLFFFSVKNPFFILKKFINNFHR